MKRLAFFPKTHKTPKATKLAALTSCLAKPSGCKPSGEPQATQAAPLTLGAFGVGGDLPAPSLDPAPSSSPAPSTPPCLHPSVPAALQEVLDAGAGLLSRAWGLPFLVLEGGVADFRARWDAVAPTVSKADRTLSGAGLRALGLLCDLTAVMEARCAYAGNPAGAWLYGLQRLSLGQLAARRATEVEALRASLAQDLAARPF